MDQRTEPSESHVLLQVEATEKHLEGHLRIQMGKLRAVDVETHGALRAILHPLQPKKLRLRIDEAPDQPRGGDTIDPQSLPGGPRASPVVVALARLDLAVRGMWLIGRKARVDCSLRIRECPFHLLAPLAREEVTCYNRRDVSRDAGQPLPRFGLTQLSDLVLDRIQALNGRRIVLSSIEKRHELGILGGRFGVERQELHDPARSLDLGALFLEHPPRAFPVGKQIGAIAQKTCAGGLQRAPDAHAKSGIVTREIGDKKQPCWSWGWHCR